MHTLSFSITLLRFLVIADFINILRDTVIVTSRDTAMAKLSPVPDADAPKLQQLAQNGVIRWNGKKPKGGRVRPKITGKTAAARVIEDRG